MAGFQRLCDILKLRRPCRILQTATGHITASYPRIIQDLAFHEQHLHLNVVFTMCAYVFFCVIISIQVFVDRAQVIIVQLLCMELWQSALGSPSPN